jgi:uncharacterized protein YcaQ
LKKKTNIITLEQARSFAIQQQGLLQPITSKGKKGVLNVIEHLGYVQIDTLAVVARAHHHTLWTRLPDYSERFLNQLVEEKSIFEYWSHAASYLPMSDYRYSLPRKKEYADGKSHWFGQDKKMKKFVLDRIKAEGSLQSKDFEFKRNEPGNWYEWKPAKRALEQLFMEGELMVAKRQGFQKVYDLAERVLPNNIDTCLPTKKEMAEHLIKKAFQAHGIIGEKEITYLRSNQNEAVNKELKQLLSDGYLTELIIDGLEKPFLIKTETYKKMGSAKPVDQQNTLHIISPFDNLIIQRKRVKNIFDFDYMVECYLPEPRRQYGYFTLPVLYNNSFVARFDPKADRASKTFYIKSIHFEKSFKPDNAFNTAFVDKLKLFAEFNGCNNLSIEKADAAWKKKVMSIFKKS